MPKLIRGLAALLLLAASSLARAEPPTPRALAPGERLEGRFVQERHLEGFASSLRSEGRFVLVPGKGLVWRSETPVETAVAITPAGILQLVEGAEAARIPAARAPFIARLFDMLGGALGGDFGAMEHVFTATRSVDAGGWRLELAPRNAAGDPMLAAIRSIAVAGADFVREVEIRKAAGDWERLRFTDHAVTTAPLRPEDAALFARAAP